MNVLIGVISPFPVWVMPRHYLEQLRREFPHHTFLEAWDRETVRQLLPEADAAFTPLVDPDIFDSLTRLRWIQSPAVGVGGLLHPAMVASAVVITTARGVRARSMAEHVLGVTLALARSFPAAFRAQAAHQWAQTALDEGGAIRVLHGRRIGIVGLGSIGREIARLAAAIGLRVAAIRRRAGTADGDALIEELLLPEQLPALLATSDIVVLCAPLTPATHGLIGSREVAAMKRGALLINVGRGQLIDDDAVIQGLRDGQLGGAALDVFREEPLDPASPYWDLPNVIVTPHVSGAIDDYWPRLVALFADNLRRFESGQPLMNVVDKEAGY